MTQKQLATSGNSNQDVFHLENTHEQRAKELTRNQTAYTHHFCALLKHKFVIFRSPTRHQHKKQRHLLYTVISSYKCVQSKKLHERVTNNFKGAVHKNGLRVRQYG